MEDRVVAERLLQLALSVDLAANSVYERDVDGVAARLYLLLLDTDTRQRRQRHAVERAAVHDQDVRRRGDESLDGVEAAEWEGRLLLQDLHAGVVVRQDIVSCWYLPQRRRDRLPLPHVRDAERL